MKLNTVIIMIAHTGGRKDITNASLLVGKNIIVGSGNSMCI